MIGDLENPKCPMGHEMELLQVASGGWRYGCTKCATSYKVQKKAHYGWLSPIRSTKELAYEAAVKRPMQKLLTMAEMSKSPEEIKKGLEAPIGIHYHDDPEPRLTPRVLAELIWLHDDAIALIQQLEANDSQVKKALQDNGFGSLEELFQAYSQVKRERDAAVEDIRRGSRCAACKMFFHNGGRCYGGIYCIPMEFEWRGLPEPTKEA